VETALAWGDANLDVLELAWVLWAHRELAEDHPSLLIAGGGEHLRGFAWRQEFLRAGRSTTVNFDSWLDMRLLHPLDVSLFAVDPTPEVRADLEARMRARAALYAGEPNTRQLDVLYAYKMTGHFGAFRAADEAFLASRLPFYFRPIFTAAFSTASRHRDNHRLMRHLIERLDPQVAAIRTTAGGPAQRWRPTNLHRFAPYYLDLGRRAVRKLSERAGRQLLVPEPPYAFTFTAVRRAMLRQLAGPGPQLRHADLVSGALYDPQALDAFFERANEAGFPETPLLGRILTVELALRAAGARLV
jgi:hypothetical protein